MINIQKAIHISRIQMDEFGDRYTLMKTIYATNTSS